MTAKSTLYRWRHLLWLLMGFNIQLAAEQIGNLYDVAVPIKNQSDRELNRAARSGLRTVFVRVTGSNAVLANPAVKNALSKARTFTRRYSYENRALNEPTVETKKPGLLPLIAPQPEAPKTEQLYAVIEFESQLINQLLRDAGLPRWSSNRPTVLLWLVVDDDQGRRFASLDTDPKIIESIETHARRRGLPVKLPALDLEDMIAVKPNQAWSLNPESIKAASERYSPDMVLMGRATQLTNGQWLGRWTFRNYQNNGAQLRLDFDNQSTSIDQYIGAAIDRLAQQLADHYAIQPVNDTGDVVLMSLSGVNNFLDYARAVSYLESVSAIRHANVIHVEGEEIILELLVDGRLDQLQEAFALDNRLQSNERTNTSYAVSLNYLWPAARQDENGLAESQEVVDDEGESSDQQENTIIEN